MSATTPPPRRRKSSTIRRDESKSTVEILRQMGFPRQRAEKANAATGDNGVNLASDWLLSHIDDPEIDQSTPRQYVLYLCPVGQLQQELKKFYDDSLKQCGWNGSHTYFPHITLCRFFNVEDSKTGVVKEAMKNLVPYLANNPGQLTLEFFSQTNFIGLFVQENYYKYLSELVTLFAKECKSHGIEVEPPKKQLHVTLAYQYTTDQHEHLEKIAKQINVKADCKWELRVYSRDPRMGKSEVRRVKQAYKASLDDELDLIMGDYVFIDPNESTRSVDKWYNGTSWLTGKQGMFPSPYTEKTAETWTWALHNSHMLSAKCHVMNGASSENGATARVQEPMEWEASEDLYAKVNKPAKKQEPARKAQEPRKLYVVRHAERMDFTFGRSFCDTVFDKDGNYKPTDLNMPKSVPRRTTNQWHYSKDAPLTRIGHLHAALTGEWLKDQNVVFHHVYVSPAYRCVDTGTRILEELGLRDLKLHVEPGLFEWLGWYQYGCPVWFTPNELKMHGFNVDITYKPVVPIDKFDMDEDIHGYYRRSGDVAKKIVQKHQAEGGNVLIVGHAGTLEVCTRHLIGKNDRSSQEFRELCSKVPYCGLLVCEEEARTKKWSVIDTPIPQMTHGHNKQVNVKNLLYPSLT
ncbi:Ubiquitin-associated and SH3 domain-containing protein B [Mactra antiquata]